MKASRKKLARYIAGRINLKSLARSRPVLHYLAGHGQVSLSQIASALGLSRGTCNLHLQRLEHDRYIRRFESRRHGAGRPTVIWGWDDPANLTLALVFDVPFLHASVADFGLKPVLREARDLSETVTRRELEARVADLAARARDVARERGARLRQAVVFVPGLLDPATGLVRRAANFPALEGLDFPALLAAGDGLPCRIVPLGLAYYFGESERLPRDANTMVLHWDLGVGVVFGHGERICPLGVNRRDGKPTLPELGHVRIVKNGRPCRCGRRGCLEAYAGGWALMDLLKRRRIQRLGEFIRLVESGEREAVRLARGAAELLGRHLAWPIQVMGPDRVCVCGPMAPVFERVKASFREGLSGTLTPEEIKRLDPASSPAGEERFLRGAHRLARRLFTHPDDYALLLQTPGSLDL